MGINVSRYVKFFECDSLVVQLCVKLALWDLPVVNFGVYSSANGYRFDLLCQKKLVRSWKISYAKTITTQACWVLLHSHGAKIFFLQPRKKPQSRLMLQWHSQLFCPELLELSQAQWLQRIHEGSFNFSKTYQRVVTVKLNNSK